MVAFGVPIYDYAHVGQISYTPMECSDFKIVEVLDTNQKNIMGTNRISPYSGGYNYTYFTDSNGVERLSDVYLINAQKDKTLTFQNSKESLNCLAYTKNVMYLQQLNPQLNSKFDPKVQTFYGYNN